MKSRFDDADLAALRATLQPSVPRELAERVYTSRLLGAEPALVLHGGGNTSVKGRARDLLGDEVDVVWVKGSGSDLGEIGPAGFPACRLVPLRRMCELPALSDEDMVRGLRSHMLDPGSPTPSVEALLHALLPARFVDHTHADAVVALVDQPDSEARVLEVFGDGALFLPYVMPGFALARAVAELWKRESAARGQLPSVLVLDKHGLFTWGETARESYQRMVEAVTSVEVHLSRRSAPAPAKLEPAGDLSILASLRGALARASGERWVLSARTTEAARAFSARPDVGTISQIGTATPDHVIRTKPWPLVTPRGASDAALDAALAAYGQRYGAYFQRGSEALRARGDLAARRPLDPFPRVFVLPGVGIAGAGKSWREAEAAADVYEHTLEVISAATLHARFEPATEVDLFELEHWSLEQAKLGKAAGRKGALERSIALVTGAGSGIGLATAERFLAEGAHVLVTDRSDDALAGARERLARFGRQALFAPCDVTSDASVAGAFAAALRGFGGLDTLVSNAGAPFQGDLHTSEGHAALLLSLELNFLSHQRVAREAAKLFALQASGGALLFNASKSAMNPGPGFGPYAVPKAALVALMRQYAIDLAPLGVRANAVNADRVRTALFDGGLLEARAAARGVTVDSYFRANLLSRETAPTDVADAFVYLATAEATTGCVLTVDGGNAAAFVR